MAARLQIEFQLTKDGSPRLICDSLATLLKSKVDQIPPAYMCNKEKLVFIVFEKLDKGLKEYLNSLTGPDKTENVAFISVSGEGLDEASEISKSKGVKVAGTFAVPVKKGLFGKIKMEEDGIKASCDFAKDVANKLFESLHL